MEEKQKKPHPFGSMVEGFVGPCMLGAMGIIFVAFLAPSGNYCAHMRAHGALLQLQAWMCVYVRMVRCSGCRRGCVCVRMVRCSSCRRGCVCARAWCVAPAAGVDTRRATGLNPRPLRYGNSHAGHSVTHDHPGTFVIANYQNEQSDKERSGQFGAGKRD